MEEEFQYEDYEAMKRLPYDTRGGEGVGTGELEQGEWGYWEQRE